MNNLDNYNYIFFKPTKEIYEIPEKELLKYKEEFVAIIEKNKKTKVYGYSTLGLNSMSSIMLWIQSTCVEDMQELLNTLLHSSLGKYLDITYTLFGIKRRSAYGNKGTAETQEVENTERSKYLVVYPFTKTSEWYMLDFDKRKELMHEHIKAGYRYAHIKQHLLYAIGVDNHEFIVSYETEKLDEFQSLVMDMRSTKARMYTQNDLPILTCVYKPLNELLEIL